MKIFKDFRNELLKRREVQFMIASDKNPGLDYAKNLLAEKFNLSNEHVVIKTLNNNFGANDFLIEAFVYDSQEDKLKIEPKQKVKGAKQDGNN
jgi:ribosomal protein S24E